MDNINRRNFLRNSAIGSAGLMLLPNMLSASLSNTLGLAGQRNLSGGLTPISIIDNACMLAFCSGEVSQKSQNVLFADPHFSEKAIGNKARLAVALPAFDKSLIRLIQSVKDNHDELRGTEHLAGKHAMLFGWVAVNATYKFVNSEMNPKDDEEATLMRMHQDAVIIQGFSTETDPQKANKEDVEALLNAMLTRTTTRIHTMKPDSDDGIGWVNRMSEWRRQNLENSRKFAEVIVNPKESLAGKQFFSEKDEIVAAAIKLQNSEFITSEKVLKIINNDAYKSNFGKALASAALSIIAIDKYLTRDISKTQMKEILGV